MQPRTGADNRDATSRMRKSVKKTRRLTADAAGVTAAARLLAEGALVAFPTETVYGLGADARDGRAVAGIFEAKGRPAFNPLIVHVPDLEAAERYGIFNDDARELIKSGWPPSLSLVVPVRDGSGLSELVTAGQSSVALRVPQSDLALRLLRAFGGPIAAPSANPSGRISPTTADHVLAGLNGRIDAVIDGGPTAEGLESTIVGFLGGPPVLLREGGYQAELEGLVRETVAGQTPVAPGQLASHYAPKATLRLNATDAQSDEFLLGFGPVKGDLSLSPSGNLIEAAANLYAMLHTCDARGVNKLAIAPIPNHGLGRAINDRLTRAAAPRD